MNFITTNLNEKFLNVRKIYCLKVFIFFIKDPDPDLCRRRNRTKVVRIRNTDFK